MSDNTEELRIAASNANTALRKRLDAVSLETAQAEQNARDLVRRARADELCLLSDAAVAAQKAYGEAVSSAASHPWEGKKVFKDQHSARSWNPKTTRIFGIVQVMRVGERPGAANQIWGIPEIGQAYILPLKKDGTPGARVIATLGGFDFNAWKLVEEEAA